MTKIGKRKNKLGTPKKIDEPKIANLNKPTAGEYKQLNLNLPADFHMQYKQYATGKGKSMKDILMASFELYKKKYC